MGKLLVYVLAPYRFPVLQVFPGLPDNPAVIKAMVMLKRLVFPSSSWRKQFWFHYSCYSFKKNKTTKNLVPRTFMRKVFYPWGMCMLRICGDVVLPNVTLNPTDSHKPKYYELNNDHHRNLLPLKHIECPSQGATIPSAKSNMGDLLPPEDIIISNHNAGLASLWVALKFI